jgi:GT2 family glycosyltransferase
MATVDTHAPRSDPRAGREEPASVLVVLIVHNGAAWLRQCLAGIAGQTHRRLGVLAVDTASTDGSADLLEAALGAHRVIRSARNVGFAGGVAAAMRDPAMDRADYLLFLHDDTVLEPGAVAGLLAAAGQVEGAGVVGPKILDWTQPRLLREIGMSSDRFGYPYSPLEDDEIDQGQYDRLREVLYVSSCAMLVSREAWTRIGPPDDRLSTSQDDLDFCWRARLAGFRVIMTPQAVARHRAAGGRGERSDADDRPRARYNRERGALASILKNYGLLSLLWILPLYFVQGAVRLAVLALSRRFGDASQVVAAWGWKLVHLTGTLRRRIRVQAVRAVPDRTVRRSMAPEWIRLGRWWQSAVQGVVGSREEAEPDTTVGHGIGRFARSHPVATAWAGAVVVALVADRNLLRASRLTGAGLAAFPSSPTVFFREFANGLRSTGLGGAGHASPALGILGAGSVAALGDPLLLQKLLVLGLPALAAVGCYRAVRGMAGDRTPAVVAAATYGLSSVVLWAVSQGRLPTLVFLAGVPWLTTKLHLPFDDRFRVRPVRWTAGAALGLAALGSFFPGAFLAAAVLVLTGLALPGSNRWRVRGAALGVAATVGAGVLLVPAMGSLLDRGARGLADPTGSASFFSMLRLAPGGGPGSWVTASYLPLAAAAAVLFMSDRYGRVPLRLLATGVSSVYLAWLAGAGRLPDAMSNPAAYLGVAGFAFSMLVGLGLSDVVRGVGRADFGHRQVGAAVMTALVVVGGGGQVAQAVIGSWAIGGPDRVPPAYALVDVPGRTDFRVLWLGGPSGRPLPVPGGLPDGEVSAGPASVRFAIGGPGGTSALDTGRVQRGPGYDALESTLEVILAGDTSHGGALLAPFGVRFIVAGPDLPEAARLRLEHQVDLDLQPGEGLTILANAKAPPVASVVGSAAWAQAAPAGGVRTIAALPAPVASPLGSSPSGQVLAGPASSSPGLVYLAQQFDARWVLDPSTAASDERSVRAFGWATGFPSPPGGGPFVLRFEGQGRRRAELAVVGALWVLALWATRRPARAVKEPSDG